ncbi:uncharacterized mitochondrial protein AtMg00810-like [Pyrus communis]|uniref:uncharacterized mitochondrial protein AtMg00810-like n=1 Tax=Pyrus communis TaxID=23211 RepID=UPI0035C0CB0B
MYVDDIVYIGSRKELMTEFKSNMMNRYEMTNLGLLHHFLSMRILQTENGIFIGEKKYVVSLLGKCGLKSCKPVSTSLVTNEKLCKNDGSDSTDERVYRQIMGNLLYVTATRIDITFDASLLARFMHCSTKKHLEITKRVMRYIQGTIDYEIEFEKGKQAILIDYYDIDWSGSEDDMNRTFGYAFTFSSGVFS